MDGTQNNRDLEDLLRDDVKEPSQAPNDSIPPDKNNGGMEPLIDEDHLMGVLKYGFLNDVQDKDSADFSKKRKYDIQAYYGIKDKLLSKFPWPNSSNFPEPITPVLIDAGHSALMDSMFHDMDNTISTRGIGEEDQKNAKKVNAIMNWTVGVDCETMYSEQDANIFQALVHGTSSLKMLRSYSQYDENGLPNLESFKVSPATIPITRIFCPIDAKTPDKNDCERYTQIVPWMAGDLLARKRTGQYKNLDKIGRGDRPGNTTDRDLLEIQKKIAALDLSVQQSRDMFFPAETYITYYPKNSLKPIELIVWWSPASGKLLRYIVNEDGIRPFSHYFTLPLHGFAFHQSWPDKIRNIQEKANYTDKQVTDAADKAISPAGFYEEGTKFDPNLALRSPSGMYPIKGTINWEPVNISAILERKGYVQSLWLLAERSLGVTDIYQGVNSPGADTLGGDIMREKHANVRFSSPYKRINTSWKQSMNQIYYYIDKFMPRKTKLKILGSSSISTIDQLFPQKDENGKVVDRSDDYGLQVKGKFDFNLAGRPVSEIEQEKQTIVAWADSVLGDQILGSDEGNRYRLQKKKAEALGIKDFCDIVRKPPEADVMGPEDVINAFMSGSIDVQPSLDINPVDYVFEIMKFQQTENYKNAEQSIRQEFQKFLVKVDGIAKGKDRAFKDFNLIEQQKNLTAIEAAKGANLEALKAGMQSEPQPPTPEQPPVPTNGVPQ